MLRTYKPNRLGKEVRVALGPLISDWANEVLAAKNLTLPSDAMRLRMTFWGETTEDELHAMHTLFRKLLHEQLF